MLNWVRTTGGIMGRSPDCMNVTFAAWAGAAEYFMQCRPELGENLWRYYEYICDKDLTFTHVLINLQRSRSISGDFNLEEGIVLRVMREIRAGMDDVHRADAYIRVCEAAAEPVPHYLPLAKNPSRNGLLKTLILRDFQRSVFWWP
jgi:hypothetical protein